MGLVRGLGPGQALISFANMRRPVIGAIDPSPARLLMTDRDAPPRRRTHADRLQTVGGSWEDGAVLRDRTQRVFARPEKVHRIRHNGRYFQIEAIHLCEPSPQRTPLIYQAGASSRGRQFAATHAECVFINGPSSR